MAKPSPDRVFNPHGRRHYRRTYSTLEVRIGLAILAGLIAIAAWVYQRGQHTDPRLFAAEAGLEPAVDGEAPAGPSAGDRGPLPGELAVEGYREGRLSRFGPDNLYVKINGRADFFKARGFVALFYLSLQHPDPNRSIDVELYDMGKPQNALGTYAAERAEGVVPERVPGAQLHREPSALFMARGRFYVRATAASAEPPVDAQLERLKTRLNETLEGAEGPWSEALFATGLGLSPDAIGYLPENAFSFGFARGVHTVTLDDGETKLFVMPTRGAAEAQALIARFTGGFATYGEVSEGGGHAFVADRYLQRVSVAGAAGPFVFGVVAAADRPAAADWLAKLSAAVAALPEAVRARALSDLPAAPDAAGSTNAQAYAEDEASADDETEGDGHGEPTDE